MHIADALEVKMSKTKKRYWLKLHQNFLDSNEIAILEGEQNGHSYIVLWLRLLLLCLGKEEHDCGFMRLNENIPYSPKLLSRIFKMNVDLVQVGMKKFLELGMLEILEDGTYYIECVQNLIGKESDSAERVRKHRERKALQCNTGNVKLQPYKEEEKEEEKEEDVFYFKIFEKWKEYGNLIKHKTLQNFKNKISKNKIKNILLEYDITEVLKSIDNYSKVLESKETYWSTRWTLWDFLSRGLDKFVDKATPFTNYKKNDNNYNNNRITPTEDKREVKNISEQLRKKAGL